MVPLMHHGTALFTYICHEFRWNVGKYTIHDASGYLFDVETWGQDTTLDLFLAFFERMDFNPRLVTLAWCFLGDWGSCWAHGRMAPRTRRFGWIFAVFDLLICLFVVVTCWVLYFLNLRSARCWSLLFFHCFFPKTFMVGAAGGGECIDIFQVLTSLHHNRWLRYRWPYYIPRVRNSPAKQRLSGWSFYLFNLRFQGMKFCSTQLNG